MPTAPETAAPNLETLVDKLVELPSRQGVLPALLAAMADPDAEPKDIAAHLRADPGLSARILALANSAWFGQRQTVTDVWSAAMVVGLTLVRTLAITTTLNLDKAGNHVPERFWDHAVAAGAGASVIGSRVNTRPAEAFSAALLHDLGIALLCGAYNRRYRNALSRGVEGGHTTVASETAAWGAGHDAIGAAVMEALHFPSTLREAARDHNVDPKLTPSAVTKVVIAGVALAEEEGFISATEPVAPVGHALKALDLDPAIETELVAEFHAELAELHTLLSARGRAKTT